MSEHRRVPEEIGPSPGPTFPMLWTYVVSGLIGTLYALVYRVVVALPALTQRDNLASAMSIGFLFVVPFAVGVITILLSARGEPHNRFFWVRCIFLPWTSIAITTGVAAMLYLEGSICIVFALPVSLSLSSLGGVIAGALLPKKKSHSDITMTCVALLPLLTILVEAHMPGMFQIRTVKTSIIIHAGKKRVWENVARVRAIQISELPANWVYSIGFPRPVEATLSREAAGGVRHASFTRGLMFTETIYQ